MHIHSLNIGLPKDFLYEGRMVSTGIFKYPTDDILSVKNTQIDGDGQADLKNHGGVNKAVYAYPLEHYDYWHQLLGTEPETGAFGENLTTQGLLETGVHIGDQFAIGTTVMMAVQPRMPCYKLNIRFNNDSILKSFLHARKFGIYFKVIQEGHIKKNDTITLLEKSEWPITIQQVTDNYVSPEKDYDQIRMIVDIPYLPERLKNDFTRMLKNR